MESSSMLSDPAVSAEESPDSTNEEDSPDAVNEENDCTKEKARTKYYKLFQIACLGLANGVLGMTMGVEGTTYLDIMLITGSDVQRSSLIFSLAGAGSIVGSISSGPLCDRFPTEAMLAVAVLGAGIFFTMVPWFSDLTFLLASMFVAWIFLGILEAALPLRVIELWNTEDAPYTHVIYLSLAIGGIIGPVISEPFLSPWTSLISTNESAKINSTEHYNESRIYIPYLITGLCYEVAAILWLCIYLKNRNDEKNVDDSDDSSESSDDNKKPDLSGCYHVVILLCLGAFFMFSDGIEDSSDSFLMTFLVAQFRWDKFDAARAVTVFWVGYTVGKVAAVVVSRVMSPYRLTMTCLLGTNAILVSWVIVSSVTGYSQLSWILTGLLGFFIAPTFAACLTFTNAYRFGVSSNVMGWIMTCADVGNTLTPLLIGYLLQNTIPMSYLLTMLVEAVFCLVLMLIIAKAVKNKQNEDRS